MPRSQRIDLADQVYHIINRANAKRTIFFSDGDYLAFEEILMDGVEQFDIRLYVFELMPNHWHLVLSPIRDGDMGKFMAWLCTTHTARYHTYHDTVGFGHVYQGRYKSFIIESDGYFHRVCRYAERNALRAGLVANAEDWRWSSAWIRKHGTDKQKKMLSEWPVEMPDDYLSSLNEEDDSDSQKEKLREIRTAVNKEIPFGSIGWKEKLQEKFGIVATGRPRGRPKKG